ncbi:hypothetical protein BKA70DRAFT_1275216, partial [Coprinopsis sp. MPI-PUGE-AT-0042]
MHGLESLPSARSCRQSSILAKLGPYPSSKPSYLCQAGQNALHEIYPRRSDRNQCSPGIIVGNESPRFGGGVMQQLAFAYALVKNRRVIVSTRRHAASISRQTPSYSKASRKHPTPLPCLHHPPSPSLITAASSSWTKAKLPSSNYFVGNGKLDLLFLVMKPTFNTRIPFCSI